MKIKTGQYGGYLIFTVLETWIDISMMRDIMEIKNPLFMDGKKGVKEESISTKAQM